MLRVQRVLPRQHTCVNLGASATLDGEEERALFLTWEEIGQLLAYASQNHKGKAIVAMRDLPRDVYSQTPPHKDLRGTEVAHEYWLHCYKVNCKCNYLPYLEKV